MKSFLLFIASYKFISCASKQNVLNAKRIGSYAMFGSVIITIGIVVAYYVLYAVVLLVVGRGAVLRLFVSRVRAAYDIDRIIVIVILAIGRID